VLNRVHTTAAAGLSAERALAAAEALDDSGESALTAAVLRVHAERAAATARDERLAERFRSAHPTVPVVRVPAQAGDVHDLDGLRVVGAALTGDAETAAPGSKRAG
jgi:hypothetical protein